MNELVRLDHVSKRFGRPPTLGERAGALIGRPPRPRLVHAVADVSLSIHRGEALGLVGESGCGKSTLGRVVAGVHAPSEGAATIDGAPAMKGGRKVVTRVQMVFQDPFASLDPRMRVGETIAEGPLAHGLTTRSEAARFSADWLARVGLDPAYAGRFPHQFSGGQRQRVAIARALAMNPDVLVCDEPVASLDVSIQAQIINLFLALRRDLGLTMLFISHDLSVVRHLCDRVAIMYLGRIVEIGPGEAIYRHARHPYTQALLASSPKLRLSEEEAVFAPIAGELPSPLAPPSGCSFRTRCPLARAICAAEVPALRPVAATRAACHFAEETGP